MNVNNTNQVQEITRSDSATAASSNNAFNISDIMTELAKLNGKWRDAQQEISLTQQLKSWDIKMNVLHEQKDINQKTKKASILRGAFGSAGAVVGLGVMAKPMVSNVKNHSTLSFGGDKFIGKKLFNNENLGDIDAVLKSAKGDMAKITSSFGVNGKEALDAFQDNVKQQLTALKPTKSPADGFLGMARDKNSKLLDFATDKTAVSELLSKEQSKLKDALKSQHPDLEAHVNKMCTNLQEDFDGIVDNAQKKIYRAKESSGTSAALSQGVSQLSTAGGEFWATALETEAKSAGAGLDLMKEMGDIQRTDSQKLLDGARETSRQMRDVLTAMNSIYEKITSAVH